MMRPWVLDHKRSELIGWSLTSLAGTTARRAAQNVHMPHHRDIFQEWRAADRAAHSLEQEVVMASMRALDGLEPAPLQEAHDRAHELRDIANDLFKLAMEDMKLRAARAKR
jgi:hypothetical protein